MNTVTRTPYTDIPHRSFYLSSPVPSVPRDEEERAIEDDVDRRFRSLPEESQRRLLDGWRTADDLC